MKNNLFDASVRAQLGEYVTVASLIPIAEEEVGKEPNSFRCLVQRRLDRLAETVNSPNYAAFQGHVAGRLAQASNQDFLIDLERTVLFEVQSLVTFERFYYADPYMAAVVRFLLQQNRVCFWTSAVNASLEKMCKALIPPLATIPAIGRNDWERVVWAYHGKHREQLTDLEAFQIVQNVCPMATKHTYEAGCAVFDEMTLRVFALDPTDFVQTRKYPQVFISPQNGFFVDDNRQFIDCATKSGWPLQRAIQCDKNGGEAAATRVMEMICMALTQ